MKIFLIVLLVIIVVFVILYFVGRKAQKKQAEQQALMEQNKQTVSMLIIDKKKVKLKDAGFPQAVLDQAPKMSRNMKVYVVKAKVGPQILSLLCDDKIFDTIPVKKEVKATISGMYILGVKGLHGKNVTPPPKKRGFFKRTMDKLQSAAGNKPAK